MERRLLAEQEETEKLVRAYIHYGYWSIYNGMFIMWWLYADSHADDG